MTVPDPVTNTEGNLDESKHAKMGGGLNWEFGINIQTTIHKTNKQQGFLK